MKTYENGSTVRQNNQAYLADIDFQSGVQLRIILNTSQYTSFQKNGIEIFTPDGTILHRFSDGSLVDKMCNDRLHNQLFFVERLFECINELHLSEVAVCCIEDLVIQSYLLNPLDIDG